MTVYLTSDLHIWHTKVANIRGFTRTTDHDEAIMESLSDLTDRDSLWILGDLSANAEGERRALSQLSTLPCQLHLICGNHDRCSAVHRDGWKHQQRFMEVFESVQEYARCRGPGKTTVMLSHYPYRGDHTHQPERISGPRQIHIGWDAWHRPVTWDEICACITENP